ncbi:ACT domain-containing protein [Exophiala viscosa]|uniref:ACT domain-containing protein n=1 Tax=Exophiala viscosa TaxID=2486360 RepID=A0AAN6E203_9EURO|nr:ACT domain-containing protein [Exophiala viscosa]
MADSMNLISAQISFLEPHLALIHIPIELYGFCLQPILRLLFGDDHDEDASSIPWTNRHDFLNISITPVECSIICSRHLADRFILPVANVLNRLVNGGSISTSTSNPKTEIEISTEDYIVIQVDGQGLDAGQRVLELTSPLAMAGISIFFITTYFSDYILVPHKSRRTVTKALQKRGFVFSHSADAFVSQLSPSSPAVGQGGRLNSNSPLYFSESTSAPSTPPAKDLPELQVRTFTKLKRSNIIPLVDSEVRLASCAGSREIDVLRDERLKSDLLQVLISTSAVSDVASREAEKPSATSGGLGVNENHSADANAGAGGDGMNLGANFLSLTITAGEPISVLVEHRLLERLGQSLLGAKAEEDALIPITLDLRDLPLDATGIVCGVAGRLAQGDVEDDEGLSSEKAEPIEISFLSTARAGTVIVRASQLQKALDALEYGMKRAADVAVAG